VEFSLDLTIKVNQLLDDLKLSDQDKLDKVDSALAKLAANPRHPSLNSHPYETFKGPNDEPIWESYVENNTPSAWRLWWYYGPDRGVITVVEIGPHP
jgi:hypothetical protein